MVTQENDTETLNNQINDPAVIWALLEDVYDPEVPVLSIIDLGIVRSVQFDPELYHSTGGWEIIITPTYSGCPAMDVINMMIRLKLVENGITNFKIRTELSPAWTTNWMTQSGKEKLMAYGISPPSVKLNDALFGITEAIECPRCRSKNTVLLSEFGSTACKALYQCTDCKEPFDYFKCH